MMPWIAGMETATIAATVAGSPYRSCGTLDSWKTRDASSRMQLRSSALSRRLSPRNSIVAVDTDDQLPSADDGRHLKHLVSESLNLDVSVGVPMVRIARVSATRKARGWPRP